ncbi:hypothetical protein [Devosia submarina]|uniref:hypothetical protein n=1 Tax=Devosia submarina TaxID=1173082 RepID=UPI000D3ABB92|nr:hypothetical protein [Devosia submarina]
MTIVDGPNARLVSIADAVSRELQRQGIEGADVEAIAEAVQNAMAEPAPPAEGKRPQDLNSTNDD